MTLDTKPTPADVSLMNAAENEIFSRLLVARYEETIRELQKARRERCLAECHERECQEEIQLLKWKIQLAELAPSHD